MQKNQGTKRKLDLIITGEPMIDTTLIAIPKDLLHEIIQYTIKDIYILDDWVDETKLDIANLSINRHAIDYLRINIDKVDWKLLSLNPSASELFREYPDKVHWDSILFNEGAIDFIRERIIVESKNVDTESKINWRSLSMNNSPKLPNILLENPDKLSKVSWISLVTRPDMIDIIRNNLDKLDVTCWKYLCHNSAALDILLTNKDKINWNYLANNHNPEAIELLRPHIHELSEYGWYNLASNPNAIDILEANIDLIEPRTLATNPGAIKMLEKIAANMYIDTHFWRNLCSNPNATPILEAHSIPVSHCIESLLRNPAHKDLAIKMNITYIEWDYLAAYPHLIDLIKLNLDDVCWRRLSQNPAIFKNIRSDIIKKTMKLIFV